MYSIGQRLREERLRKGLNLADIAEHTRIRLAFLEAIEADRFEILPGRFFARSFIHQYARELELDDPELEAEIMRQLGEASPETVAGRLLAEMTEARPEKAPVLWRSQPVGRSLAYATLGLLAVAAFLGLYLGWRHLRVRAEEQPHPALVTRPEAPSFQPPAMPSPTVAEPESSLALAVSTPATEPATAPPAPRPTEPPAGLVAEVSALRPSWIQVTADGRVLFTDTLQPGQSRSFRASQAIRIVTGNAGALEIRRNGQPIGPVGPEGQIRAVELTTEGYTVTAPRPRTSSPETAEPEPQSPPA